MSFADRFITRNGNRKLRNMRCPLCNNIMRGPLARYVTSFSGTKLDLLCPACRQAFEIEAKKIQFE